MEVYTGGADYFRRPMYLAQGLTDESTIMVYGTVEGTPNRDNLEDSEDIEVIFVDKAEARRILAEEKVSARASFMLMIFINSDEDKPFDFLNKQFVFDDLNIRVSSLVFRLLLFMDKVGETTIR